MQRVFSLVFLTITGLLLLFYLTLQGPQGHVGIIQVLLPRLYPPNHVATQYLTACSNLVVHVDSKRNWWLNQSQLPRKELRQKLAEILKTREHKVVFFVADTEISYGDAIEAIDAIRDTPDVQLILISPQADRELGASMSAAPAPKTLVAPTRKLAAD